MGAVRVEGKGAFSPSKEGFSPATTPHFSPATTPTGPPPGAGVSPSSKALPSPGSVTFSVTAETVVFDHNYHNGSAARLGDAAAHHKRVVDVVALGLGPEASRGDVQRSIDAMEREMKRAREPTAVTAVTATRTPGESQSSAHTREFQASARTWCTRGVPASNGAGSMSAPLRGDGRAGRSEDESKTASATVSASVTPSASRSSPPQPQSTREERSASTRNYFIQNAGKCGCLRAQRRICEHSKIT